MHPGNFLEGSDVKRRETLRGSHERVSATVCTEQLPANSDHGRACIELAGLWLNKDSLISSPKTGTHVPRRKEKPLGGLYFYEVGGGPRRPATLTSSLLGTIHNRAVLGSVSFHSLTPHVFTFIAFLQLLWTNPETQGRQKQRHGGREREKLGANGDVGVTGRELTPATPNTSRPL